MGGLGWQELVIVLIIVIIIFGAGRLPEIGGALGKGIKEFKSQANSDDELPAATTTGSPRRRDEGAVIESREIRADEI